MIKTVLYVPLRDNDGRPFDPMLWRALEAMLRRFGGFTRLANVSGEWTWQGQTYRDRSRPYVVALASWRDITAWLDIVEWARTAFRQEAIYIEIAGLPEAWGAAPESRTGGE